MSRGQCNGDLYIIYVQIINTVKLAQNGIARDPIYFPHWPSVRIIQNCKQNLKSIKIILHGTYLFMVKIGGAGSCK
jgi:hypothetical protein